MTKTVTFQSHSGTVSKTGRGRAATLNGITVHLPARVRFTQALAKRMIDYVTPELWSIEL
jgi:hypothetical protein